MTIRITDIILGVFCVILLGVIIFKEPKESVIPEFYKQKIIESEQRVQFHEDRLKSLDQSIINLNLYLLKKDEQIDTASKSELRDMFNELLRRTR